MFASKFSSRFPFPATVGPFPFLIPILIPTPVPMPIDAACPKTKPLFAELETNQDRPEQEDVEQQL